MEEPSKTPIHSKHEYDVDENHSFYEGHSMQKVTLPVRIFKLLGVETVVGKGVLKSRLLLRIVKNWAS